MNNLAEAVMSAAPSADLDPIRVSRSELWLVLQAPNMGLHPDLFGSLRLIFVGTHADSLVLACNMSVNRFHFTRYRGLQESGEANELCDDVENGRADIRDLAHLRAWLKTARVAIPAALGRLFSTKGEGLLGSTQKIRMNSTRAVASVNAAPTLEDARVRTVGGLTGDLQSVWLELLSNQRIVRHPTLRGVYEVAIGALLETCGPEPLLSAGRSPLLGRDGDSAMQLIHLCADRVMRRWPYGSNDQTWCRLASLES